MKRLVVGLFLLVLLALGGAWLLDGWLEGRVATQIQAAGQDALGVPVTVEDVDLSLVSGRGAVVGLLVENPNDFDTDRALEVSSITLHLDVASLRGDVIIIPAIVIEDAQLFAEQRGLRRNNLLDLLRHLRQFAASTESEAAWPATLHVERFAFTGASLVVRGPLGLEKTVAVPDVVLTNIGTAEAGVPVPEALRQMLEPVLLEAAQSVF